MILMVNLGSGNMLYFKYKYGNFLSDFGINIVFNKCKILYCLVRWSIYYYF